MRTKKLPFINVGFEFTAAPHAKKGTDGLYFTNWASYLSFYGGTSTTQMRTQEKDLPYQFEWINENYQTDECGCEVPTPVIKNIEDVTNYFKSFKKFTNKYGFTTSLKHCGGLGGCHIHLDLSWVEDIKIKKLLVTNIGIYITNNPQLNWAFNDYNDNINANTLITPLRKRGGLATCTSYYGSGKQYAEFKYDRNPYRAFMHNPLGLCLYKKYGVRYDKEYDTVELRIFDMPDTLERHLLHYDVAMAIYKHCYKLAVMGKKIRPTIKDGKQIIKLKQTKAITKLKEAMKELGITYKRVVELEYNIATRYEWTTFSEKNGLVYFNYDSCYLL